MTPPFTHYGASSVLIEQDSVRDTEGAAFGVNGAANVLIRRNIATRIGARLHVLEVGYGSRSCDGGPDHSLGLGDEGCRSGSSCTPSKVLAENEINGRLPAVSQRSDGWLEVSVGRVAADAQAATAVARRACSPRAAALAKLAVAHCVSELRAALHRTASG